MAPSDPYVYPGTGTLRNNFDIRDTARLRVVEASLTAMALAQLDAEGLPGGYDVAHLQAFHRAIFRDVYPWAGQIRTVQISRMVPFARPENIEPYLSGRLRELAAEGYLRGLPRGQFIARLARYLGEVNAVHPFRDGNGRTQRAFFGQLARNAGHRIRWDRLDTARNIEASRASLSGHDSALRALLTDLVEDLRDE
jgi:cell filamentation protein